MELEEKVKNKVCYCPECKTDYRDSDNKLRCFICMGLIKQGKTPRPMPKNEKEDRFEKLSITKEKCVGKYSGTGNPIIAESDTTTTYFIQCCDKKVPVDSEGSVHCPTCNKKYKIKLVEEEKKEHEHEWFVKNIREIAPEIVVECEWCDKTVKYILNSL